MLLVCTVKDLKSKLGSRDEKKASFGGDRMTRKKEDQDAKAKARQSSSCEKDASEEEEGLVHSDTDHADTGAQKAEQEEEMHTADHKDDDLEEGEIRSEDESDRKTKVNPVCSLYLKGSCIKGEKCKFVHCSNSKKGNYKMFDHPPLQIGTKSTVEGQNWSRLPQTNHYNSDDYFNESSYFVPSATVPQVDRFGRQLRSSTKYAEPLPDREASPLPRHATEEWNNPWSRPGPRHKSRPHSRSASHSRSRSRSRSAYSNRSRSCSRSTYNNRSRSCSRSSHSRSRSCSRSTYSNRSRSRSRSTYSNRSWSRSRSTARTRSRRRSRSRSSSRSQSPISPAYIRSVIRRQSNSTFRSRSRSRAKSARSPHSYSGSRSRSPSANRHLSRFSSCASSTRTDSDRHCFRGRSTLLQSSYK